MVMAINGGKKIPGLTIRCTSQVVLVVKEPTCQGRRHETWVRSLCQEDPLEEGMATNSSVLACRIPIDRGAWWAAVHGVAKCQT